jgi:competence protein ComFC
MYSMSLSTNILNFFLPPQCLLCRDFISESHNLCEKCWSQLEFITNNYCLTCFNPLEENFNFFKKSLCDFCKNKKFYFDKCFASLIYNETSKKLLLQFKYADVTSLGVFFNKLLVNTYKKNGICDVDYIVPIPLHWQRLIIRKYNQSSILAKKLSKSLSIPVLWNCLYRIKKTDSQGKKTKKERLENLKNVFTLERSTKILGKNILIVDDVMATGATINEASKILKKNGAGKIYTLVIAKASLSN